MRRRASRFSNDETIICRSRLRPSSMKNNVPKNTSTTPIAGVSTPSTGCTNANRSTLTPLPSFDGSSALRRSRKAATGASSTCSLSCTLRAMSGALPIHSTTGAASSTISP